MILDPNDPTGIGLFSKCGRNHASKFKSQRSHVTKTQPKTPKDQPTRKKVPIHFGFDKQESRQQRQKKYKNSDAPPVGHYHPIQKQKKPKLIWDILKVYNSHTKPKLLHSGSEPTDYKKESSVKLVETIQNQFETVSELAHENKNAQTRQNNLHTSVTVGDNSMSGILSKSQCMVNMSRMTGRKEIQIESIDWGEVDIMKSVSKIKGPITKNIYFDKQPREKPRRILNYSASYNCNYDVVKPRKKGLTNFSILKGRQQKTNTSQEYSYQHYDYNSYVWQQFSHVYPNTKTHLISFDKQTNRYTRSDRKNNQQEEMI